MKSYAIFPTFDLEEDDERSRLCIEVVTTIVVEALRQGGDHFHYAVDWLDPGAAPDSGIFNPDIAQPHVRQLGDADALHERIRKSVDPYNALGSTVRSIATCRSATFGYDGQAFLCLRLEDKLPTTPDPSLAVVEERCEYVTQTDYFDGWVPGDATLADGS
ncbi:hypothetical protein [Sphingomonas koreensis]